MASNPAQWGGPPIDQKLMQPPYYSDTQTMYFPPPPSQAHSAPGYGTPPVPLAYGAQAPLPNYQPNASYFPEKQQYQNLQPQQSPWQSPAPSQQQAGTWGAAPQAPPPPSQFLPDLSWSSQTTPSSPFPPTPHYTPLPQYATPAQYFPPQPVPYSPTPDITSTDYKALNQADDLKNAKDDQKSNWGKRFVSNTLAGRVVRASVQSVVSTATLPAYLSPWGDNNPITLPNLRKRDAALGIAGHFGIVGVDTIAPSALDFGSVIVDEVVKLGLSEGAAQFADEGIDHTKPKKPVKITRSAHAKTVQARIKHKLIGVDAELRLVGEYPTQAFTSIDKGWFSPYLYASGRAPSIARSKDFAIASHVHPNLRADFEMAPKLLSVLKDDSPISALCDTDPYIRFPGQRLLVLFLGISPWRTNAWSQARNPNEARFNVHLLNGVPAFVLPVDAQTPGVSWSPWTLNQMCGGGFDMEKQSQEIFAFLESVVSVKDVSEAMRLSYRDIMWMGIRGILQAAMGLQGVAREIEKTTNLELGRAGVVMFRY